MNRSTTVIRWLGWLTGSGLIWLLLLTPLACVDDLDITRRGNLNVIVVDGRITNLIEPQIIRLNRSGADATADLPYTLPLTKATVAVVVDSTQVITAFETGGGNYQLPSDFRGQIGHAYQLRFTLSDGTRYESTRQVMAAVPPITAVRAQFNPTSLAATPINGYTAGHDVFMDTQDPANQANYYRWEWNLYEKQTWCVTCNQGVYAVNAIRPGVYKDGAFVSGDSLYENCFVPNRFDYGGPGTPFIPGGSWYYDYNCRSQCWAIIHSHTLNVFDDRLSNGGLIANRKVAQIPYYTHNPCLVEIRQFSLTVDAYQYDKRLQEQTQNTGGLADTPPTVLPGNVHKLANPKEVVVGYFTASAVATFPYWLDRNDTLGKPIGATDANGNPVDGDKELFYALNARLPYPEPPSPYTGGRETPKILIYGGPARPPTALCVFGSSSTPFKPIGWRD